MELPIYNGVRAEPKFLRDPTSLESISSGISKISSYVTSNLSKRRSNMIPIFEQQPHMPPPQQQQQQQQYIDEMTVEEVVDEDKNSDTITFASFDKLNENIMCLLLGYQDGFQLWDITNPDNVHEICSIRDKETFGTVSFIHLLRHDSLIAIV
ncbi:hypothetical protein RMCBS344292_19293 [Rhizopus microsporus]|nr:hypothetical protein RMCBS344292_19293 [Rhizopus microsporus]